MAGQGAGWSSPSIRDSGLTRAVPVFGIASHSYADGGVATNGPAVPAGPGPVSTRGLPRLAWPERNIETAFVLGGGGNRGAAQIGMLRALLERHVLPDLVVGTSIGAINAAAFAGCPTLEGIELAAEAWRKIGARDIFPKSRFPGQLRFFERRPSVFSAEGLRGLVGDFLRYECLEHAELPLVVVATRLRDSSEVWLTEGPALDALMASCALPAFYPVVSIDGERYLDGGVVDNVPLSAALAAGARRIFVLLCGSVEPPSPGISRPYEALFAAFTMALNARLRRDLAHVPGDVDVVVLELTGNLAAAPLDFSKTVELIAIGYRSARLALEQYESARPARQPSGSKRAVSGFLLGTERKRSR
ncbi:MAG: patatin-like phospholipase family protein [Acidimicrobiales bacterium]